MTAPSTTSPLRPADTPSELLACVEAHVRDLLGEDDSEFTGELVASFCDSVGALCDRIEVAMAAGDIHPVMACAHQIKGSAANIGLSRIAEDWNAIEEAARHGTPERDRRDQASGGYADPDRRVADLADRVAEAVAAVRHVAATLGS